MSIGRIYVIELIFNKRTEIKTRLTWHNCPFPIDILDPYDISLSGPSRPLFLFYVWGRPALIAVEQGLRPRIEARNDRSMHDGAIARGFGLFKLVTTI